MRNYLFFVALLFFQNTIMAQTIEEAGNGFFSAVGKQNDSEIVSNGTVLIAYFNSIEYPFDTIYGNVRIYTAQSLLNLGKYQESLKLSLETKDLVEMSFGKDNGYFISVLSCLGQNYSSIGEFNKALQCYLEAKLICENIWGKSNYNYSVCLRDIADVYVSLGMFENALECDFKVEKIIGDLAGKDHPDYSACLVNIATDYSGLGKYMKSLEFNFRALDILNQNH